MAGDSERGKLARATYQRHTGKEHRMAASPYDTPAMTELANATFEGAYAGSWARPELDLRAKSFISMTVTASLGTMEPFKKHVRAAHNLGISKDEMVGMLFHLYVYLGSPRLDAARAAVREVWKEMAEDGK